MESTVSIGAYTPSMTSFTCVSCGLLFDTSSEQKIHFKSEFHRFNLKRKCVGLPPVSEEAYQASLKPKVPEKKQQQQQQPPKKKEGEEKEEKEKEVVVITSENETKKEESFAAANANVNANSTEQTLHTKSAKKGEKEISSTTKKKTKKSNKKKKSVNNDDKKEGEGESGDKTPTFYCLVCDKKFRSARQFEIHYESRKHYQRAAAKGVSPAPPPEMVAAAEAYDAAHVTLLDMDDEALAKELSRRPRLTSSECLFCNHKAENIEQNMLHMAEEHSFFVPDLEYCVDLEGLLGYLGEQITVWNRCICCSPEKGIFRSLQAVRAHMSSLQHCRMRYEDPAEYVSFYDFEECPFMRVVDEDEDGNLVIDPAKAGPVLADNGYELLLPDGRVVGHRSMATTYAQNVRTPDWREQVLRTIADEKARKRIAATPGGVSESALVSSAYTPAFLAEMRKNMARYQEKTKIALDRQAKQQMKIGIKQNKIHVLKPQILV